MSSNFSNNLKTIVKPVVEYKNNDIQNIIDANKFIAITMNDISFKLSKLIDISIKNEKILSTLLDYTVKNEERLKVIQGELVAEADSGEFLRVNGTVTTTQFTIIDTDTSPGYAVKGYTIKNDGPNTIFVAHNAAISSGVDVDPVDVTTSAISKFEQVLSNEDIKFVFNRRKVRNIHLLAQGGNSQFRAWLVW